MKRGEGWVNEGLGWLCVLMLVWGVCCCAASRALGRSGGRVYEMVSPLYKGGYGANRIEAVAPDGEGVAFDSLGVFAGAPANMPPLNAYIALRTMSGWSAVPLMPLATVAPSAVLVDFSATLGSVLFLGQPGPNTGAAGDTSTQSEFLVHGTNRLDTLEEWEVAGGVLETLENHHFFPGGSDGESADLSHILFTSTLPLVHAAIGTDTQLYDLVTQSLGGEPGLHLVGVRNKLIGGEPEVIDPYCPVRLGAAGRLSSFGAIAADGSVIFFTTNVNRGEKTKCNGTKQEEAPGNLAQLFARVGGSKTLEVSRPLSGTCSEVPCPGATTRAEAAFDGASEDGSRVFFTTAQPLVSEDVDEGVDLYMARIGCPGGAEGCEAGEREVTSLAQISHDPHAGQAAQVQGVVAVAPDGSRVYFVARGDLLSQAEREGLEGEGRGVPRAGADNLYVYDSAAGSTAFVAGLCSGPAESGEKVEDLGCPLSGKSDAGLWLSTSSSEAQVNSCAEGGSACEPGRFLIFSTYAQLVRGDTDTAKDVYRYDALTGALDRVSAGEDGHDANGNNSAFDASLRGAGHGAHVSEQADMEARAIGEDGSRVVFTSSEPLSPDAINALPNAYEWHKGPGEAGEGRVSLISSGNSIERVEDVVIAPSGRDIFFVTAQGLVPQDTDGAPDIYDARLGGGFPPGPAERQPCSGDACQGPVTNPAPLLVPGSVSQAPGEDVPVARKVSPVKKPKAKRRNGSVKRKKRGRRAGRAARVRLHGAIALNSARIRPGVGDGGGQRLVQPSARDLSAVPSAAAISGDGAGYVSGPPPASAPEPMSARTEASEGKPFEITHFALQATGPTRVEGNCHIELCRFVNEPYSFTQAGGHPWALTTTIQFASEEFEPGIANSRPLVVPTRDPKDIVVDLPPGLLGDPLAVPRCSLTEILDKGERCPGVTQVGWARLRLLGGKELGGPIVNLTPEAGQSAEFGLENESKLTYVLTGHLVHTAQGYGFNVASNGIPMTELVEAEVTFWGVPADPSHDPQRGLICKQSAYTDEPPLYLHCTTPGGESSGVSPVPFLLWPTDCGAGPETAVVRADSWEEPGRVGDNQQYEGYVQAQTTLPGVTGCERLGFGAGTGLGVEPDTLLADEPVGLGVRLSVPLSEAPQANATPQLRNVVTTLPAGMSVSPGVVDGIQACDEYGPRGINITGPESEELGPSGELRLAPGHCPDASTVGEAEAITPFLPVPVKGHVYLARPGCGGVGQAACTEHDALDGNLYKLYLELGGTGGLADTGIEFKVAGNVEANPATGQLTTRFENLVQAPYSEVKIRLNGGPRAPLDNPASCGPAVTTADLAPWSAPGRTPQGLLTAGTPDLMSSSYFNVKGCSDPPSFGPGFVAGTVTPSAGKFSSFTLNLSRKDREQYVKGIQLHTPPGLLAMLARVPLCDETDANAGTCPESSKIGTTRVASGAGSHPFEIEGNIYLTGPYQGAPFGLSVATHAAAGPFDLGVVVVRARIDIDPETSTAIITIDETGPYALPQIIFGVPLRLQRITVNIDRPGFMFNPTSCKALQIVATISGNQNAVADVQSPFAANGCKNLAFKSHFSVSTNGHTSRNSGASLDAKVSYPAGSLGNAANIARVKVSLPKQLPSRLTTLQKACPAATFDSNPAACPKASVVGIARALTPLLPALARPTATVCPHGKPCPKEPPTSVIGPVYFVSHGGEAFPQLIVVLQGDNVRVDLAGSTFIDKKGITSSTFKTVPDVPVNTFELYLPQGKNSALAANGNLCKTKGKLNMPTEFVAQNHAITRQNTKIQVTGCDHAR